MTSERERRRFEVWEREVLLTAGMPGEGLRSPHGNSAKRGRFWAQVVAGRLALVHATPRGQASATPMGIRTAATVVGEPARPTPQRSGRRCDRGLCPDFRRPRIEPLQQGLRPKHPGWRGCPCRPDGMPVHGLDGPRHGVGSSAGGVVPACTRSGGVGNPGVPLSTGLQLISGGRHLYHFNTITGSVLC